MPTPSPPSPDARTVMCRSTADAAGRGGGAVGEVGAAPAGAGGGWSWRWAARGRALCGVEGYRNDAPTCQASHQLGRRNALTGLPFRSYYCM